jgi:hypothetical protein
MLKKKVLQKNQWVRTGIDDVIESCREEPLGTRNNKAWVTGAGVESLSSMVRLLCPFIRRGQPQVSPDG